MLAKYQSTRLENLQKRSLRVIYGYEKTYEQLLEESDLKTLEERREIALLKFASKTEKTQFEHWFPRNENKQSERNSKPFREYQARSEHLYRSPLYTMRRLLNSKGV